MNTVQLAVYDLSRGMARALSQQILGQQIDGIWHTGIVVFGREYFYGGGIQTLPAGNFAILNQLPMTEQVDLGHTEKRREELESFLLSIRHRFTQSTYDLITNNCNHFAHEVARFLSNDQRGIPEHIVNLPQIVFSTPGGMMLRPMIESMQQNIRQQQGVGLDPFGQSNLTTPLQPNAPSIAPTTTTNSFENALSESLTALARNMMENESLWQIKRAKLDEQAMISSDASAVSNIGDKLLNLAGADGVRGSALTEDEKERIKSIIQQLQAPDIVTKAAQSLNVELFTIHDYSLLEKILAGHPEAQLSCLFILRLMFLHDKSTPFGRLSIIRQLVQRLLAQEGAEAVSLPGHVSGFATVPAHIMALCAMANLLSHDSGSSSLFNEGEESIGDGNDATSERVSTSSALMTQIVDIALKGLNHDRPEVRQMSATLAYNLTLACTKDNQLSGLWKKMSMASTSTGKETQQDGESNIEQLEMNPEALQLLCGCLENIQMEKDVNVRHRRLATVCRIIRCFGPTATELVKDLGMNESLQLLKVDQTVKPKLTSNEQEILDEIVFATR